MHALTRVANYEGDIASLLRKYADSFMRIPIGDPKTIKYGTFAGEDRNKYLIMVSQNKEGMQDYNVILSVHGPVKDKTEKVMSDLEKAIEIETRPAPKVLQKFGEELFSRLHGN